jgi:hypothetical protein
MAIFFAAPVVTFFGFADFGFTALGFTAGRFGTAFFRAVFLTTGFLAGAFFAAFLGCLADLRLADGRFGRLATFFGRFMAGPLGKISNRKYRHASLELGRSSAR